MDVLSHALLGFILGKAFQLDSSLQLVLVVSCISLDIDALSIRSRETAFRFHRGPVHSVLAALIASVVISIGYVIFMRLPRTVLLSVMPVCLAGLLSHVILDLFTTGNMAVLWPLSRRNFAFNLTHFNDPTFLGALLTAALFSIYMKTDASMSSIVAATAIGFLAINLGIRCYMKNAATRSIRGLDARTTSEVVSLPTLRPDRWWGIRKTSFENGYRYEIYRIDSVHNKVLSKRSLESPYMSYSGPVEPPIDSTQKAVAYSKRDKRINKSIEKFILPAVDAASSNSGDTWQAFWYDAFTQANKRERRGILAKVNIDGTITVDAHWMHTNQPYGSKSLTNS